MEKPFTIKVQETEQKIIEVINNSQLPAYVLKVMLNQICQQIESLDQQDLNKYYQEQNKEKESEQNGNNNI